MTSSAASSSLRSVLLGIVELQPLDAVLRRLAEAALGLTGADYAAIGAYDDQHRLEHFESFGLSADERDRIPHPPLGAGLLGEFALHPSTINVPAYQDHPASTGMPEGHSPMGPFLGVPVTYGRRAVGAFYVTRRPGAPPFSADDEAQLEALAPYAAIAMANARTLESEHRRTEAAETLASAAAGLQTSADERESALVLCGALRRLFPQALEAAVAWTEAGGGDARSVSGSDEEGAARQLASLLDEGAEPGPHDLPRPGGDAQLTAQLSDLDDGGTLAVAVSTPASLEGAERASLRAVQQLGVVGFGALRKHDALAALERYAIRDAIARDLHDDVIQSVYAVGLGLRTARTEDAVTKSDALDRAAAELNAVIADLRSYIQQLSGDPQSVLPTGMLSLRLRTLLSQTGGRTSWTVDIDTGEQPLDARLERQLYLVAREVVSNVVRHAAAAEASLSLRLEGDALHRVVRDDGVGFDRSAVGPDAVGLRSIEQRVADLDGSVVVESQPGRGTTVTAKLPLVKSADAG